MTTARAISILARTHWRVLVNRVTKGLRTNRLMMLTITSFLLVYAGTSYFLVAKGIDYVHRLPVLGPLLTERLVYLMFFLFFVMLVISNATITGMGLFRRREAEWQVALPIPPRALVMWKTLEGMALASWGLMVLSAPILAALGRAFDAGPSFYLVNIPALLCLVTLAANLSTWTLLAAVRWARRSWLWPVCLAAAVALIFALSRMWTLQDTVVRNTDISASVGQILRHTEAAMHPMLPSAWVAESILSSGRNAPERTLFFNLVLLSNALIALLVTVHLAGRWFPAAWNRLIASSTMRKKLAAEKYWYQLTPDEHEPPPAWARWMGLDRASLALLRKDTITFLREPSQWGQSLLIFGLLFMYTSNLRRLGYDLQDPFWLTVLSYLNLLVCSLALSTLTTRFIFPQFSMEGQRLWLLGMSPVPLKRILALKLRLSATVMAVLTSALVLISSLTISLPWHRVLLFVFAICMMSFGLTALALALGTILPNFREPNPARIVSGFGGTLCLIGSFLYIICSMTVMVFPAVMEMRPMAPGTVIAMEKRLLWEALAAIGVLVNTIIFGGLPYFFAKTRTENLEYLGHVN